MGNSKSSTPLVGKVDESVNNAATAADDEVIPSIFDIVRKGDRVAFELENVNLP
jgi:hypothetical protein